MLTISAKQSTMNSIYKFIDNVRRMWLNANVAQPEDSISQPILPANANIDWGKFNQEMKEINLYWKEYHRKMNNKFAWDEFSRKFNIHVPENMKTGMIEGKIFIINDY